MMRFIPFVCALALLLIMEGQSSAAPAVCPDEASSTALVSERHLKNWNDLYNSSLIYGECKSGILAEGYSHFIVYTLSRRWDTLGELKILVSADNLFEKFILDHINASADPHDVVALLSNTKERCPADNEQFCSAMEKAVRRTLQDLGALRK